ncbi:MAG: hypothetical protein HGB06_00340 [Chlorobaculum sp.]|nr:hypothetical protein [Chlorobaculum sp.]
MKRLKLKFLLLSAMLALVAPKAVLAETTISGSFPNIHGKSLSTPIGWGAAYGTVFAGAGGTIPAPYSTKSDAAMGVGFGIGNPKKQVGFEASVMSLDLSDWKRYSANLKLHRYLGCGSSVAVGVENILLGSTSKNLSDSEESYYIVYSQGVQDDSFIKDGTNTTKLHYSIGIGNGRFWDKSPYDVAHGKGKHGTAVFGNVAYELFDACNGIVEWNGMNLALGASKTFMVGKQSAVVASAGLADLTGYTGDGVRFIWSVGGGIMF